MHSYEDVVAALEEELGWDVAAVRLHTTGGVCTLCGKEYSVQPMLCVVATVTHLVCLSRVDCNVRMDLACKAVADAVTLLPTPDDDAPPSMGTSDREDDQPIAVAEPIVIEGREDAPPTEMGGMGT